VKKLINQFFKIYLAIIFGITQAYGASMFPNNFVYLKDIAPSIQEDIRYATYHNFIGRPLPGYENPICILTRPTALALLKVQWAPILILWMNYHRAIVKSCVRSQISH